MLLCVCMCVYACCTVYYMCYVFWVLCLMYIRFMLYNLIYATFKKIIPTAVCYQFSRYCERICIRCAVLQSCHGAHWLDATSRVTAHITAFGWRSISVGVSLIKSLTFPSLRKYVVAVRSLINHTMEFLTLNFHRESQYRLQDWRRIAR